MNKKIDDEFLNIHDEFLLQCICTEFKSEIIKLQSDRDKFKLRCFKAYKMIYDNYGLLDKFQIDLMEDILTGGSDD